MWSIVCPLATCHLLSIDMTVCRGQEEGCQRDHHHLDHHHLDHHPRGPQCLRSSWRLVVAGWLVLAISPLDSRLGFSSFSNGYVLCLRWSPLLRTQRPGKHESSLGTLQPCNIPSLTNACCICCNPRYTRCRKQNTSKNQEPMKRK